MEIKKLSKSSIDSLTLCEQQYTLDQLIGLPREDNVSGVMGNCFHTVMEKIAKASVDLSSLDMINLVEDTFNEYVEKYSNLGLVHKNLTDCKRWFKKALEFQGGRFDPRNNKILAVEKWFDFEYEGVKIRGFIDLITDEGDKTIRVLDYKTGSDWDFLKKKKRDYDYLNKDLQLRLYHYASHKLYPEVDTVIVEVYYVNVDKVFTLYFDKEELYKVELFLSRKIAKARAIEVPKLNIGQHCKYCTFFKNQHEDTGLTQCEFFRDKILEIGLEKTIEEYKNG